MESSAALLCYLPEGNIAFFVDGGAWLKTYGERIEFTIIT
jgi:hypothetical protein